jgi:hypothetical protein
LIYCDKLNDNMYFACLEIDDVSADDAGKYRVHAKNNLGESNATINLNFDSKLSFLKNNFIILKTINNS